MKPLQTATVSALALIMANCAASPSGTATAPLASAPATPVQPAQANHDAAGVPLPELVAQVNIPYESFTLANGLQTIVHTDRKAPVVGVTLYYRVGSKHEPRGKTGFAHLFEHLMFSGSENVENFDVPLEAAGSTSTNGSTYFDRTNYVETVPTGALDLALFMESDRMGYLLGSISQDKLDKQRGVVQNEKRQGDNQPYGLVRYKMTEGLFPIGHPYRHSTIGSMADLEAASLGDVRQWFIDNYGPNNVVLALAGDIDAATARPMVERWFGAIPRGQDIVQPEASYVDLAENVSEDMTDQVPVSLVLRGWTGPDMTHADSVPLAVGMHILGGLASSRLDNALVREEQVAVGVSAGAEQFEQLSMLQIQMQITPGVEREKAMAAFDAVIARMLAEGPTADELERSATQLVSGQIGALEAVGGFGGKGATLAEGLLYTGSADHYKHEMERLASLTPADVQQAMQRWLGRPSYTLTVLPGERTEDGALLGGWGDEGTVAPPAPDAKLPIAVTRTGEPRTAPEVAPVGQLAFPQVQTRTLSNGIEVALARRTSIPKLSLAMSFNAGNAADGSANAGQQSLMMEMLKEGTTTRSAIALAEEQERLGVAIASGTSMDRSSVQMSALSANLRPSLALFADIVRNPAFVEDELERLKEQRLASIAQERASPTGLAQRALGPLIYGPDHPYGTVGSTGLPAVIEAQTAETLRAVHDKWLRPDLATITVVGDVDMDTLVAALEESFGNWQAPATPVPNKNLAAPVANPGQKIIVINRPNSPQSVVVLSRALPLSGAGASTEALDMANEVIGNGFLSRLNLNLREDKGWTYGIRSSLPNVAGRRSLTVMTPVQADKTADSIKLILDEMSAFPKKRGVDATELQRVTEGKIRNLPNLFQTNSQVLGAILQNRFFARPLNYQASLPQIISAIDADAINEAAQTFLQPDELTVIVVGDRKEIDGQLATLGLPIEYLEADGI